MTDANDILMGSGAPAAKFERIGATVTGTVVREPEARQQTEFRTGVPLFWKDGSPKMQVVVQLATNERDPERPDDDGTRALYIKGKNLTDTIRSAVRQSGANGIHTGGVLTVQYIADGQAADAKSDPPKLYAATYQPPAASFNGVASPATQQQAPPPAVQQTIAGTGPACPPGIAPDVWARMDAGQRDRVLAAMAPASATHEPPF
ncbi:hypothetical protein Val02_81820 [Virgisporangium aliadipatigenens]|uniref:Uncharacterized protein n=1 Tax=Virgisporangium aliadipatigenens TaxID=741659 RepID=A0A8J4DVC2_9ACTN|nr:hypothetical protein [Virgisporangium aliadipatigenens]GIJ51296.1 hypothetical protein Val02_81820 [Virgisporangium aliadipatigenens]